MIFQEAVESFINCIYQPFWFNTARLYLLFFSRESVYLKEERLHFLKNSYGSTFWF